MRVTNYSRLTAAAAAAVAVAFISVPVQAAVTVSFTQVGGDVVATTSGNLNTSGLTAAGSISPAAGVNPLIAAFNSASTGGTAYNGLIGGPSSFGPGVGGPFEYATSGSGDFFRLVGSPGYSGRISLPLGYVSGSPLNAVTTFAGQTLASLGLAAGSYVFTTPSDSVTVKIGVSGAVPEPATWAMMLLGFGGIGFAMRRKRIPVLERA